MQWTQIVLSVSCALLSGASAPAWAQPSSALSNLRTLGPEAEATWAGLAVLVQRARTKAIHKGRPSKEVAAVTRRGVEEAFEALSVLERAGAMRGEDTTRYRRLQHTMLDYLNRSIKASSRFPWRIPQLELGGGELPLVHFKALPNTGATVRAFQRVANALVMKMSTDLGARGELKSAPLRDQFADTMALARGRQTYRIAGSSRSGSYRGQATISVGSMGKLSMTYTRSDGGMSFSSPMHRRGDEWHVRAEISGKTTRVGAAGRLAGLTTQDPGEGPLTYRARFTLGSDPKVLQGRWQIIRKTGRETEVVDSGTETLTRVGAARDADRLLHTSSLMDEIIRAVRPVASKGTVPAHLMVTASNSVHPHVYQGGRAIFNEFARMIVNAKSEVLIQTYIWDVDSQASGKILQALETLNSRPGPQIRVRLVVNSFWAVNRNAKADLEKLVAGMNFNPKRLDVRVTHYRHLFQGVLHSKSIVVDGSHAMLTGASVQNHFNEGGWFDTGYRVDGPAAYALRMDVAQAWHKTTGGTLPSLRMPFTGTSGSRVMVISRRADGNLLMNGTGNPQSRAILAAIKNAKREICIQTPNLNDIHVKHALIQAVERGVLVRIVLSKGFNATAEMFGGGTNQMALLEMVSRLELTRGKGMSKLFLVRWYSAQGGKAVEGKDGQPSHAKFASFDGEVAIVGSSNLDIQSLKRSREIDIVVDDEKVVAAWNRQLFLPQFNKAVPAY